jgi:hypothetical protein
MALSHARKRIWTPDIVRQRIQTSMIANRLTDHVLGKCEMSATQVSAALGLLRKTLPDMSAVAHSGSIDMQPQEMTDSALIDIASRGSIRASKETSSQEELSELH